METPSSTKNTGVRWIVQIRLLALMTAGAAWGKLTAAPFRVS